MKIDKIIKKFHLSNWNFSARACLIALLVFLLTSCGKKEEPPAKEVVRPVKMMTIASGDVTFKRSFPGKVKASQQVDLAFKVSGPLVEFPVNEGQSVKIGKLLARIDPRDFKINLDKAKAHALEAEQQYKRYKDLYIKKQVSKADFDKYRAASDIARAQKEDAQHALSDTYLRAPFAGVIAKKFVENFQEVRAKQPIVSLQDVSSVEIHIDVPEAVMARFRSKGTVTAMAEFVAAPGK